MFGMCFNCNKSHMRGYHIRRYAPPFPKKKAQASRLYMTRL